MMDDGKDAFSLSPVVVVITERPAPFRIDALARRSMTISDISYPTYDSSQGELVGMKNETQKQSTTNLEALGQCSVTSRGSTVFKLQHMKKFHESFEASGVDFGIATDRSQNPVPSRAAGPCKPSRGCFSTTKPSPPAADWFPWPPAAAHATDSSR